MKKTFLEQMVDEGAPNPIAYANDNCPHDWFGTDDSKAPLQCPLNSTVYDYSECVACWLREYKEEN